MVKKIEKINKVTVEAIEAAIKQPLKPLIVKLLMETQSPSKTAAKLSEMSGILIDYNALYYINLKLGIKVNTKLEVIA